MLSSGATDSIPLLINAGANINAVDKSKNTPLHHSAMSGHHQTIQLLLKRGSNIHAVNNVGNSALMEAVSHGHEIAVTSLLREGADPRVANNKKVKISKCLMTVHLEYLSNVSSGGI